MVLQDAWNDLTPTTITYQSREINPQFASFVDARFGDYMLFVIQLPNTDAASFDIIYHTNTKTNASQLRSRVQSDISYDDETWREEMEKAVLEIPLRIKAKLSEPKLSMKALINLKQGDVFQFKLVRVLKYLWMKSYYLKGKLEKLAASSN